MATTVTPLVPASNVNFGSIQRAFPGLAGAASNCISDYYGRYPTPTIPASYATSSISFSSFRGITALTPSFNALANVPVAPTNAAFPTPLSGTNAVVTAGGLVTAVVGGASTYAASLAFDLLNYLDNKGYHLGTGVATFAVQSGALPTGATLSQANNGTLTLSTSATNNVFNSTVVFRCTNFYGNYNTATIKFNLVPALYYGGALAIYNGESYCPTTGLWADVTGSGRTATTSSGAASVSSVSGRTTLTGGTGASITFPAGVLPSTYTLVHIAAYNGANKQRIVTSADGANWLSGHCLGGTGVAYHNGWLTGTGDSGTGATWILSSDQNSLYRCNGMAIGGGGGGTSCSLGINTFAGQASDWAVAMVAVYPSTLTTGQLYNIEQALASQYGMAWKAADIGGTTLNANAYSVGLTGIFQNCTSYGVPSNSYSATSISGSTMTTTGATRNTAYGVQVSGTAANGSVALTSFTIVENQQTPWVYNTFGTQSDVGGGGWYCPNYISVGNGSSGYWTCSGGWTYMSGWTLIGNTALRNTYYWVTMAAYNYRYDGANQLGASFAFLLYESQFQPTNSGYGNQTVYSPTSNNDYNVGGCFSLGNGSNTQYSVSSNHPNWSALGAGIRVWAYYRNASYWVNVTATTYRFDGGTPKSTTVSFYIYEPNWPAPTYNNNFPSFIMSNDQQNIKCANYFDLKGCPSSSFWVNSSPYGNTSMSGSTLYVQAAYRNTSYWVQIGCNTTGGTTYGSLLVSEGANPQVCVDCSGDYYDVYNSQQAGVRLTVSMNTSTGYGTVWYHWTNGAGDYQYADLNSTFTDSRYNPYYDFWWPEWNTHAHYSNGTFTWENGALWVHV